MSTSYRQMASITRSLSRHDAGSRPSLSVSGDKESWRILLRRLAVVGIVSMGIAAAHADLADNEVTPSKIKTDYATNSQANWQFGPAVWIPTGTSTPSLTVAAQNGASTDYVKLSTGYLSARVDSPTNPAGTFESQVSGAIAVLAEQLGSGSASRPVVGVVRGSLPDPSAWGTSADTLAVVDTPQSGNLIAAYTYNSVSQSLSPVFKVSSSGVVTATSFSGSLSGLTGTLPVTSGGTGADNPGGARTNLGAAPIESPLFTGTPKGPSFAAQAANNTGTLSPTGLQVSLGGPSTTASLTLLTTGWSTSRALSVTEATDNIAIMANGPTTNSSGRGVYGSGYNGVLGHAYGATGTGVAGEGDNGATGVRGSSNSGNGVSGASISGVGVVGQGVTTGIGVYASSVSGEGLFAKSQNNTAAHVYQESASSAALLVERNSAQSGYMPLLKVTDRSSTAANLLVDVLTGPSVSEQRQFAVDRNGGVIGTNYLRGTVTVGTNGVGSVAFNPQSIVGPSSVVVTPKSDPGVGARLWVDPIGPAGFTVHCEPAPSSSITVMYVCVQ